MARVQDIATITATGLGLRDQETIDSRAYLVWEFARKSSDVSPAPSGPGLWYRGNLTRAVLALWPSLSGADRHDQLEEFRKEIYAYLRATGNARCIQRSSPKSGSPVIWWLSSDWKAATSAVVLRIPSTTKPTRAENKLTPKEAGEDREPAPVEVHKLSDEKDTNMAATLVEAPAENGQDPLATQRRRMEEEHETLLELLAEMLSELTEPAAATEIAEASGFNVTTVRTSLDELVADGKAFVRRETKDEKTTRFGGERVSGPPSKIYASTPTVLARTRTTPQSRSNAPKKKRLVNEPNTLVRTASGRRLIIGATQKKLLNALSRTFEKPIEIADRAGVSSGSATHSLKLLAENGIIDRKPARPGSNRVLYRRGRSDVKTSTGAHQSVETSTPTAPTIDTSTFADVHEMAVSVVEGLIAQLRQQPDTSQVEALTRENDDLRAKLLEAESRLSAVQAVFGSR